MHGPGTAAEVGSASAVFLEWRQHAGEDFQAQVFLVAQTVGPTLHDADLVVEALDEPQRHFVLGLAEGGDSIPVVFNQAGELLIRLFGRPPLPRRCGVSVTTYA